MAEDREIYFYSNTLANSLSLLKVKERVIISDENFNIGWKDTIGDFHIGTQQKYYDLSGDVWVYPDNEFGEVSLEGSLIFHSLLEGLKDQYLVSPIPISEDGVYALSTDFIAISVVGCLNEVRSGLLGVVGTTGKIPKFKVGGLEDSIMYEDSGVMKGTNLNFTGYVKCIGSVAQMVIDNNANNSSSGILELWNSRATPADGGEVGRIQLMGYNSLMASKSLCEIVGRVLDVTDGTEDGEITLSVTVDGSYNAVYMKINDGFKFYIGNPSFLKDGIVMNFGVNSDVTLTHVHDTGLLLNSALQFRDSTLSITSNDDGNLDLNADIGFRFHTGNVSLVADGVVTGFGVNSDVTLTHVHDTGLLLNSALQFRDSTLYISSKNDGYLDFDADVGFRFNTGDVYSVPWTDYSSSSTVVGFSGTPTKSIFYKRIGKMMFVTFLITGTSDATNFTFTLPYNANNQLVTLGICSAANNSVDINGAQIQSAGTGGIFNVIATLGYTGSAWTASGTKAVQGTFFYELA